MTCGIYRLVFNGTDKVYIGQSKNIEKRYLDHIKTIRLGLASVKLTEAFNMYGKPSFDILVVCTEEELDDNENESIDIWDAYNNGFNSRERATGGGRGAYGESNSRSIYTNKQIESVFFQLLENNKTIEKISWDTQVSIGMVYSISNGSSHLWLHKLYPLEFELLKSRRYTKSGSAYQRGLDLPIILNPQGAEFKVDNIRLFAREHGLDPGALNKVLNKKKGHITVKGWRLKP